jgi:hypothetical protein
VGGYLCARTHTSKSKVESHHRPSVRRHAKCFVDISFRINAHLKTRVSPINAANISTQVISPPKASDIEDLVDVSGAPAAVVAPITLVVASANLVVEVESR